MGGVDSRVDAAVQESKGFSGRAAKDWGPTLSQPERADITFYSDICKWYATSRQLRIWTHWPAATLQARKTKVNTGVPPK
jgi:hypothetical protein